MNKMKITTIKERIEKIDQMDDDSKKIRALHRLSSELKEPKVESRIRGNFVYFYQMRGYYDSYTKKWLYTNEKALGKLPLSLYQKNKSKIDKMPYSKLIIFIKNVENNEKNT